MIVIITVNVPERTNGYLSSIMLEVNPGVFVSPNISRSVLEKTWNIVSGWWHENGTGNLLMMKTNKDLPGNIELRYAGSSRRKIVTLDDILCVEKAV